MYHNISIATGSKLHELCRKKQVSRTRQLSAAVITDEENEYDEKVGKLVLKLVSTLEQVSQQELTSSSRGRSNVCLARQMSMYLIHTVFSVPYHRVAVFLKRDRTTISHACKLVEDLRDNEEFDKRLETMENLLVSARALGELERRRRDHDNCLR